MRPKMEPSERSYPRQVRMTDAFYERAVAAAKSEKSDFSEYVRALITTDFERRDRRARR